MSAMEYRNELQPQMTSWRRDFHAHPEIGYEEHRTSGIVAAKLAEWGIEVHRGLGGGTGIVGVPRGNRSGAGGNRAIGLRADMDALPMQESNDFEHRSKNAGLMHGCGHDGHTTMLLGAAKYLAETRNFSGTVHLIFQPAEEGLAGAVTMMDDGLFERFPCDAVYAVHNTSDIPLGEVKALTGTIMAAVDYFTITLRGRSAHAAMLQQGVDTVSIAAQVISVLNALPSRHVDSLESAVISIGQIHGGTSDIVIPETVVLRGSVRTLEPRIREQVEALFHRAVYATAEAQGGSAEISYRHAYPPTVNTAVELDRAVLGAARVVGAENVKRDGKPLLAGEDFAFMLNKIPGAYIIFGQREGDRYGVPLHNPNYDFNDALLPNGAGFFAELVEQELA